MTEACPTCDTLWRLYAKAAENLRELITKHGEARASADRKNVEILGHEVAIAESAVHSVGEQLRRHDETRHGAKQDRFYS